MVPHRQSRMRSAVIFLSSFLLVNGVAAETLPIVDLHFHAEPGWNLQDLINAFNEAGVAGAHPSRG